MLPQQKEALLTMMTAAVAVVLFFFAQSRFSEYLAIAALSILGFLIVIVWIFRKVARVRRDSMDERDIVIRYQSGIIAFSAFATFFMLTCLWLIFRFHDRQFIPILSVIHLMFFGWIFLYFTWGTATLVLYRRGG